MRDEENVSSKLVAQLDVGLNVKRLNPTYREIDEKLTRFQNEYLKHLRSRSSLLRGCALLLYNLPNHTTISFPAINITQPDPYPLMDLTCLDLP